MNRTRSGTVWMWGRVVAVWLLVPGAIARAGEPVPAAAADPAAGQVPGTQPIARNEDAPAKRKLQTCKMGTLALEEVSLREVIKYLQKYYNEKNPEDKEGVTFILKTEGVAESDLPKVTVVINDIPMFDCLRNILTMANWTLRFEGRNVIIEPKPKLVPAPAKP